MVPGDVCHAPHPEDDDHDGWLLAVIRSCGCWAYVAYLPIFAVENNLGDQWGVLLSMTNAALFAVNAALGLGAIGAPLGPNWIYGLCS